MDFNTFANAVASTIPEYLLNYEIEEVKLETIIKNNGLACTGMIVRVKDEMISPTIYLDYYYSLLEQGKTMEEILTILAGEYRGARETMKVIPSAIPDIASIKENIFIKLVNREKNEEILEKTIFVPFLNLAGTYRYLVKNDETGIASALLRKEEFEKLALSEEELFLLATENTKRLFVPMIKELGYFVEDQLMEGETVPEGINLYVLTNQQGINGATNLMFQDIIEEFAEKMDCNIYVLPSSIHEVLLLPDTGEFEIEKLEEMVQEVNEFVVSKLDYLADTVYYYDRDKKTWSY